MSAASGSLKAAFSPHLPYLRRYARALAGNQKSGDAFVRAALEALVANPDAPDPDNPPNLELFRLFHAFWNPHSKTAEAETDLTTDLGLQKLSHGRREALLLTAVEGFTSAQAATILARPVAEVEADIAAARAEISALMQKRVLIIEDEPLIAMHLESIVEDMGHRCVGIATTHREAVAQAAAASPDLVLADIQLADGSSGIDAVRELLETSSMPVIFITAYPERLLTGERPEPTWLVTKPFDAETIVAIIGQALMPQLERA